LCGWRNFVCGLMMVVLPASVMAQTSGAMLHNDGGVWLNGNLAPSSSAIFPHDLVQTQKESKAKIDADGSSATIKPDTIVQFDGDELVLDHGSVQVNTSRGMRVRVNCMTVIPVNQAWTRYDVIDVDGKMEVIAYENDVNIHYRGTAAKKEKAADRDVTVHQGEQATRDEKCGAAARPVDIINAKGAILNSAWAKGAGLAAISALACFALCHGDDPISPSRP
jgi:hypothetical protein